MQVCRGNPNLLNALSLLNIVNKYRLLTVGNIYVCLIVELHNLHNKVKVSQLAFSWTAIDNMHVYKL